MRKEKLVGSLCIGDCIFWGVSNEDICVVTSLYKVTYFFITDAVKAHLVCLSNNQEYTFVLSPTTSIHVFI